MTTPLFDAVFFDLDGTLADTAPDLISAINRMLIQENRPPIPITELRSRVSRGSFGLIPAAFNIEPDNPAFEPLKERFIAGYRDNICIESKLFEGIAALLSRLQQNQLPWGIVTNKNRELTLKLLDALNLNQANCVVCGDDMVRAKPWPDTLLKAAELLSVAPKRSLYVGDYHRDIEAAQAAGMASVGVRYGYAEAEIPADSWGATYLVDHPDEIASIIWTS